MLILAVISNLAQAYFAGPRFGGMSGVVYGLLGFIWMKSSYEPRAGFRIHPLILAVALAEFLLSLFVWQETIANYAHAGGLITGIVLGIAPSRRDQPPTEGVV
jgi:GlpG protein